MQSRPGISRPAHDPVRRPPYEDVSFLIHLFFAVAAWLIVLTLVGKNFFRLWKPGLIGVSIMFVVDYFGTRHNLYIYPGALIYIGKLPLFHILGIYATSIIYLNWLPTRFSKKLLYTIYISILFLSVEAFVYEQGGIVYPGWELWNSYFLIISGLLLFSYFYDLIYSART